MYRFLKRLVNKLTGIGAHASDTEKETLHKRFLVYVALLMGCGGLVWGSICIYHGLLFPASIPLGYVALTVANLTFFAASKRFRLARFFQLLMSLMLPFIFQWSLGGFVPSGTVMLWAMTAVLGALTFQEIGVTLRWLLAYLILTVISGALDSNVAKYASATSEPGATLFVLNVIGVSIIVFGLMMYFVRSNEIAYRQLAQSNRELVESQAQLVQAEKMASIGSLTAGIAHEMNTPLGVINSNTDVSRRCIATIVDALKRSKAIEELDNGDQVKRSLEILQSNNRGTLESSARITRVVDSLRSFIRLDEAPRQKVDLHEGIDSALYLMKQDFGDRINVVKKYGDIPHVTCYASELNQVFMHLLRNAVEAIRGPGTITIRSFTDAGKVRVQVADSGVGMSPEQVQRIFDPALTRKGSRVRAGLSLFTSYRIVEQHNGEIRIDSHLGEGTTVTVTLPAV